MSNVVKTGAAHNKLKSIAVAVFSATFLITTIALFAAIVLIPSLMGAKTMTILTGSMKPNLPPGHIIVSQPVNPDTLQAGDIVSYFPDSNITNGKTITHRVDSMTKENGHVTQIIMRGDNNPVADPPITPEQVAGKTVYVIPYVGLVKVMMYQSGVSWLGSVIGISLIVYAVILIFSPRKRTKGKPQTA